MRKYISEFVGTFVLVLIGCGVAVVVGCGNASGIIATSLAFGLVIVAMAYSIGNVSGCHINPAVSLAMLISKKISIKDFIGYVIAQCLGAILGAAILGVMLGSFKVLGANGFGNSMGATNVWIAMLVEIVLTFIFVLTILGVTSKKDNSNIAGIVIGLCLTLVHLIGIYFTGTSVNPARSFGPAILQGGEALSQLWVFIISPLIGASLAAVFNKFVLEKK